MKKWGIFVVGILIGAVLGYGANWGMNHMEPKPAISSPLSPASSCLLYGKFCEVDGVCFDCKVI